MSKSSVPNVPCFSFWMIAGELGQNQGQSSGMVRTKWMSQMRDLIETGLQANCKQILFPLKENLDCPKASCLDLEAANPWCS